MTAIVLQVADNGREWTGRIMEAHRRAVFDIMVTFVSYTIILMEDFCSGSTFTTRYQKFAVVMRTRLSTKRFVLMCTLSAEGCSDFYVECSTFSPPSPTIDVGLLMSSRSIKAAPGLHCIFISKLYSNVSAISGCLARILATLVLTEVH